MLKNLEKNIHWLWWVYEDKKIPWVFYVKEKKLVVYWDLRKEEDLPIQEVVDKEWRKSKVMGFSASREWLKKAKNYIYWETNTGEKLSLWYYSGYGGTSVLGSGFFYSESRIDIIEVFLWEHIQFDMNMSFDNCVLEVDNLEKFVNKSVFDWERRWNDKEVNVLVNMKKWKEQKLFDYWNITATLLFWFDMDFDKSVKVSSKYTIKLTPNKDKIVFSDFMGLIWKLHNFLTFCLEDRVYFSNTILQKDWNKTYYFTFNNLFFLSGNFHKAVFIEKKERVVLYNQEWKINEEVLSWIEQWFSDFDNLRIILNNYLPILTNKLPLQHSFISLTQWLEWFYNNFIDKKALPKKDKEELYKQIKWLIEWFFDKETEKEKEEKIKYVSDSLYFNHNSLPFEKKIIGIAEKCDFTIEEGLSTLIKQVRNEITHPKKGQKKLKQLTTQEMYKLCEVCYYLTKTAISSHIWLPFTEVR